VEDADLASALIEGDPAAPPLAWRRYYPMVRTALRRMLGAGEELADLSQDVFARFFAKVPQLKKRASLRHFILAIAYRRAKEEIKRRRVRRSSAAVVVEYQTELSSARVSDPERQHAVSRLVRMVGLLDAPDRDVYSLRFMEGLELAEIASAMHVSLSTVRRTLRRAVHRVGVLLQLDPVLSGYADAARAAPQRRPSR